MHRRDARATCRGSYKRLWIARNRKRDNSIGTRLVSASRSRSEVGRWHNVGSPPTADIIGTLAKDQPERPSPFKRATTRKLARTRVAQTIVCETQCKGRAAWLAGGRVVQRCMERGTIAWRCGFRIASAPSTERLLPRRWAMAVMGARAAQKRGA
jgi:hypothetical protein